MLVSTFAFGGAALEFDDDLRDAELAESIADDVLAVLEARRFFELLDDLFCPNDPEAAPRTCNHSFANAIEVLSTFGMDSDKTADVLAVMKVQGACCDCEILYNVAEESRLKAKRWKAEYQRLTSKD
jgi:hypothetical protein